MQYNIYQSSPMKEKIITIAACLLLAVGTLSGKSLVLTLGNGTHVYYLLGEEVNPMMRFVNGKVTVNTDVYEFSNIKNFYISETDVPNSIEHTIGSMTAKYGNDFVIFDTATPITIKVYASNGSEFPVAPQHIGGKTIVDLRTLPQGIYIITAGDTALKILKK